MSHGPLPGMTELLAVRDSMIHRGPDSAGVFQSSTGDVALLHRRLRIIDLESGEQPFLSDDGSIALVFNGEIYNYLELRENLKREGHGFSTQSDTEVLLRMYEQYGRGMVSQLRGMYAFAIYDGRNRSLWLARDRLGKKPIFYTRIGGSFAFSSSLHGLTLLPGFDRSVSLESVDLFLSLGYIPSPKTIFRNTRKLQAGHELIVDQSGVGDQMRYWSLPRTPTAAIGFQEAREEFARILHESVALRLISDVPLGCFLSGGIDSTAVATVAAIESTGRLKTFSARFSDSEFDESPYARKIAENLNTDHVELPVEADAIEILPDLIEHFGEPFGDSSAVPTWRLSEAARKEVTVVLNGDGGDENFAGYDWYRTANRLNRLASQPWFRLMPGSTSGLLPRRIRKLSLLLSCNEAARFAHLRLLLDAFDRRRLYGEALKPGSSSAVDLLTAAYEGTEGGSLDKMLSVDQLTYLADDLLPKVDVASMANSLEARSPLLDHKLVEFVASLPVEMKMSNDVSKVLLRDFVFSHHGEELFDRPKQGFSLPLRNWLRESDSPVHGSLLNLRALMDSELVNPRAVTAMIHEHQAGKRDHEALLWNLLILDRWLGRYGQ